MTEIEIAVTKSEQKVNLGQFIDNVNSDVHLIQTSCLAGKAVVRYDVFIPAQLRCALPIK